METTQMTPIISSTFSALTVCNSHFLFENSQNLFRYAPPFCPFWSVKYLNFWQKLPIWKMHHAFLESRHPELLKIHILFCPSSGAKKKVSAYGLVGKCPHCCRSADGHYHFFISKKT